MWNMQFWNKQQKTKQQETEQEEESVHIRNNHPKVKLLQCELFQDHQASKGFKIIICDFGCGQTFETEDEINEHMKTIHW